MKIDILRRGDLGGRGIITASGVRGIVGDSVDSEPLDVPLVLVLALTSPPVAVLFESATVGEEPGVMIESATNSVKNVGVSTS